VSFVLAQTVVPHYRQAVFELLQEIEGDGFELVAGTEYFDPTVRTRISPPVECTMVRNHYLFGRRLLWQSGCVIRCVRSERVILELNPRILNVWMTLVLRRVLRRRTTLWGKAWPHAGRDARSDGVRNLLRLLAGNLVLYTETEAEEVRARNPRVNVTAAPNALYPVVEGHYCQPAGGKRSFLCVGRLADAKKPGLALEAFAAARPALGEDAEFVFVGEGPLREELERQARELEVTESVRFAGFVPDLADIRALYGDAVASVSPAFVGLSLMQSLWFGVPMIIAGDEPHSPEIEAAVEGKTAFFVPSDSVAALAARMVSVWRERDTWLARRAELAAHCHTLYSAEHMAARLSAATRRARQERTCA
jgi:glycosyltransferase involved in cell wall biosynthesis